MSSPPREEEELTNLSSKKLILPPIFEARCPSRLTAVSGYDFRSAPLGAILGYGVLRPSFRHLAVERLGPTVAHCCAGPRRRIDDWRALRLTAIPVASLFVVDEVFAVRSSDAAFAAAVHSAAVVVAAAAW